MKTIETREELIDFLKKEGVTLTPDSKFIYLVNYYDNKANSPTTPLPYSFKDPINAIRFIGGENGILAKSHLPIEDLDIVIECVLDSGNDFKSKLLKVQLNPYIYFKKEEDKKDS